MQSYKLLTGLHNQLTELSFGSDCMKLHYLKAESLIGIQSTLIILQSKGLSEILRDIGTLTYQICRIKEKKEIELHFTNECVI